MFGAGRGVLEQVAVAVGFGFASGEEAEGAVMDVAMEWVRVVSVVVAVAVIAAAVV